MGWLGKLFGRRADPAILVENDTVVLRRVELIEPLRRPEHLNLSDDPEPPCATCGQPLAELFITTGGENGDPDLWRDHPVAVDGWGCTSCGVFRYPRKISPERITQLVDAGAVHGQAGRFADAELCFARVVWNWPGYMAGHLNYAEATRERLHRAPPTDDAVRRRLVRRMVEHYELAIDAYVAEPQPPEASPAVARACFTLADLARTDRAIDRARRFIATALALPNLPDDTLAQARDHETYFATRRDLFFAAAETLMPYVRLSGRPARPLSTPSDRARVARALDDLEAHLALDPTRWQSMWMYAKGLHVLERHADAFAAWERAFAAHPSQREIAQDYGLELLHHGRFPEALVVARTHARNYPDDAQAACNLAVVELLAGDLDAALREVGRGLALDPADVVGRNLHKRLDRYRNGAPLPRTLRELERGPA